MSDGITQHIRWHRCGWCCIIPPEDDEDDEFPTQPNQARAGQLPSSAPLVVIVGKFRSIPEQDRNGIRCDAMRCIGMGKGRSPWGSDSRKQFHCFTNNIKVMTRFCLSRLKLSPGPVLIFSSGGSREGCNHRSRRRTRTNGRSSDRLTDRLAHSYSLSSTALRLSFEFNRIYKFYLCDMGAFCTPERAPWDESFQFPRRRSQMVRVNL